MASYRTTIHKDARNIYYDIKYEVKYRAFGIGFQNCDEQLYDLRKQLK